jgi:predicted house-cleaning noncanonical NTP pyrophosphatase (MazG superfamily)
MFGIEKDIQDIMEVIYAICSFKKIDMKKLKKLRKEKLKARGGFKERIILDEIR